MVIQKSPTLPRMIASCAGYAAAALSCIAILVTVLVCSREASRREERTAYANLQRTMDNAFVGLLTGAREGHIDAIFLDADWGPGTDQRMERVAAIPQIKAISLELTDITDEGIRHVARLPNLETLAIFGGGVTDDGLRCLAGKQSIKNVVLDQTLVSERGIAFLKTLPNLRSLVYYQEAVCAIPPGLQRGRIRALEQLGQLETLRVGGNWVSEEMVQRLQASLPRTKVARLGKNDPRPYQPSGPR